MAPAGGALRSDKLDALKNSQVATTPVLGQEMSACQACLLAAIIMLFYVPGGSVAVVLW